MPEKNVKFAIQPSPKIVAPILHEDPDLLILNKPAGMVTQPGKGHQTDSLLDALFATHGKLLQNLGVRRDFGLLHRLDKDTSGLLVVAKSPNAYDQLRRDFEARHVDKEYLAITAGIPQPPQGVVQARLKEIQIPNPDEEKFGSVKKVVISRQGQEAISAYKVLSTAEPKGAPVALVHVKIKTGRLHQIRAHMTFLHCHVLGDHVYKAGEDAGVPKPPRLCLHAARLGFKHPTTGKWTHFVAPLPTDLADYAQRLGLSLPLAYTQSVR